MEIDKISLSHGGKEYSFSVEVMHDEDETIYRVTPDQGELALNEISPGYIEFDEKGNALVDEGSLNGQARRVLATIWKAIQEQIPKQENNQPCP